MANLIIKSSADNLVLQGSDASPAITVGATGTTTFAENATFSGTANNLGTISSATTFPAGHVLQTLHDVDTTALTLSTQTYTDTDLSISITPSSTSSKILCLWTMMAEMNTSEGFGTKLMRDSTSVFTTATSYNVYYGGSNNARIHSTQIHIDSPSSTSALTYKIQVSSHSGEEIKVNDADNQSHLLIMEIAG